MLFETDLETRIDPHVRRRLTESTFAVAARAQRRRELPTWRQVAYRVAAFLLVPVWLSFGPPRLLAMEPPNSARPVPCLPVPQSTTPRLR